MTDGKLTGYKLPVNPGRQQGTVAQGFVTPKQDRVPQIQSIPPKRVLPIIFIPGIMGSNLRMSADRQKRLGTENNIAWRPDNLSVTVAQYNDSASERQLRLDPLATEVDTYDPKENSTGDPNETADQRNDKYASPQFITHLSALMVRYCKTIFLALQILKPRTRRRGSAGGAKCTSAAINIFCLYVKSD